MSVETTDAWEKVRDAFAYRGAWPSRDQLDAARFRHESPHVRLKQSFTDYSRDCFPAGRPILACAEALSTKLHAEITYAPGETTIGTSATEVLETRRGVCQDFAHIMIACLRSRGLPARYVSGYLRTQSSAQARRLTGRRWWVMALRTPGCRCGVRPTAGSNSIRPMAASPAPITWPWPGVATSVTCRRYAA